MRKGRKGEYSELVFSALSCGGACLFGFLVVLVLEKAGAITFNMPFGILFFAFLFCCVFAINFSLCFVRYKNRKASLKSIYEAVAKISSGDYEIYLGDVTGGIRKRRTRSKRSRLRSNARKKPKTIL